MNILRIAVLLSATLFVLPSVVAGVLSGVGGTDPAGVTTRSGVTMTTAFPAPQVWINMMPGIIDIQPKIPTVDVVMTLTNNTPQTINYTFPSAQVFDIFIKDSFGNIISSWSRDLFFAQVVTNLSIAPGQSKTVGGRVELTTADGQFIYPGNYVLSIELVNILSNPNSIDPVSPLDPVVTVEPISSSGLIIIEQINHSPMSQMPLRIDWAF